MIIVSRKKKKKRGKNKRKGMSFPRRKKDGNLGLKKNEAIRLMYSYLA